MKGRTAKHSHKNENVTQDDMQMDSHTRSYGRYITANSRKKEIIRTTNEGPATSDELRK
jgi:hypothetical protein